MLSRMHPSLCAGLAAALVVLPMLSMTARASNEAAPAGKPADTKAVETKGREAKPSEAKPSEAKPSEAKPSEAKPSAVKASEAKTGETKTDTKVKDGTSGSEKGAEDNETSEKPAKPIRKKKPKAAKEASTPPGEGPSPASPPPLNMGGLRDEVRREGTASKIDPAASPRTKVEQMLAEVAKTREALHTETVRLEGMMAQEPPETAAAGAAPGGAAGGGKPAKNPLDILAKALRGIKPEQAAPIVSRLDKRLAATVLQRMPPIDAGKIMGAMKPDTAAELATQIALRVPEAKK